MSFKKNDLIKEIAKETNVSTEIVRTVLDSLVDIAIEKLMIDDEFSLFNLVKIKSQVIRKRVIPPNPMRPHVEARVLHDSKNFRASVSTTIKNLLTIREKYFADQPGLINRHTWRGALKWELEGRGKELDVEKSLTESHNSANNFGNPLLDDSDEEV